MSRHVPPLTGLDDDESRAGAWGALVLASHLFDAALQRHTRQAGGLSYGQFKILVLLSGAPDATLGLSELSETLRYSISRVSHAVTRLESEGLLSRSSTSGTRPAYQATLTPAGRKLVARVIASQQSALRDPVLDALDTDPDRTQARANAVIDLLELILGGQTGKDPQSPTGASQRDS